MKNSHSTLLIWAWAVALYVSPLFQANAQTERAFRPIGIETEKKPWTQRQFDNDPGEFQFAIVSDRTGGPRAGVFEKAVQRLNLLHPEFVMSVGDLISGYTKNETIITAQWEEFQTFISPLEAPFFYLPGNHDISNKVMRKEWMERYGRSYYAFLYHDVLFICMDSNDGDGVSISEEQVDYVKQVLADHSGVRWTMIFMHHPIWNYKDLSGFQHIEAALDGRDYTVFAGHTHRYLYQERQKNNYITLATTGGGSALRGAAFGEYDHVMWVTMTKDRGPLMVNISLEGMEGADLVTERDRGFAADLVKASSFPKEVLRHPEKAEGLVTMKVENPTHRKMTFRADLLHHHQLRADSGHWDFEVPGRSARYLSFRFEAEEPLGEKIAASLDPFMLDWSLGYIGEEGMVLRGRESIEPKAQGAIRFFPVPDQFSKSIDITMAYPFPNREILYTRDGSVPGSSASPYTGPVRLKGSTTLQALVRKGDLMAPASTKSYTKVKPRPSVRLKGQKQGLAYRFYEGEWERLPDFEQLRVKKSGVATDFRVGDIAGRREDHFALCYTGYVKVPSTGLYTFSLTSDDGAKLFLGKSLLIDNDGSHSARTEQGYVLLEEGYHPIELQYFEDYLGETLEVSLRQREGEVTPLEQCMYHVPE